MEGMWYRRCPRCGNYMKKRDPLEPAMCCACGWEEYTPTFFCTIACKYCDFPAGYREDDLAA